MRSPQTPARGPPRGPRSRDGAVTLARPRCSGAARVEALLVRRLATATRDHRRGLQKARDDRRRASVRMATTLGAPEQVASRERGVASRLCPFLAMAATDRRRSTTSVSAQCGTSPRQRREWSMARRAEQVDDLRNGGGGRPTRPRDGRARRFSHRTLRRWRFMRRARLKVADLKAPLARTLRARAGSRRAAAAVQAVVEGRRTLLRVRARRRRSSAAFDKEVADGARRLGDAARARWQRRLASDARDVVPRRSGWRSASPRPAGVAARRPRPRRASSLERAARAALDPRAYEPVEEQREGAGRGARAASTAARARRPPGVARRGAGEDATSILEARRRVVLDMRGEAAVDAAGRADRRRLVDVAAAGDDLQPIARRRREAALSPAHAWHAAGQDPGAHTCFDADGG